MILAAYIVVGFLVASIYATGMLKGRRDRLHRLGLLIPLTIGLIAAPLQFLVGDTAARAVADNQPAKFAGDGVHPEDRRPPDRVPRRHLHLERGQGGDPDPRPRLLPGRLQPRHQGHRAELDPAPEPPAGQHPAAPRLRRDGRDLHAVDRARRLGAVRLVAAPRHPEDGLVPARGGDLRRGRGALALVRLDRHRGRPPALDRPGLHAHRGSGDAARTASGSASPRCCCSTGRSGRIAILVLRAMSRRWREGGAEPEGGTPYAPPEALPEAGS